MEPRATAKELGSAIVECVSAGARLINVSVAVVGLSPSSRQYLSEALDYAQANGTVVVTAAGNHGLVGGSSLTRHAWVVPVVAMGRDGRPIVGSDLGASIGRRGLGAPGEYVLGIAAGGGYTRLSETSVAAPSPPGRPRSPGRSCHTRRARKSCPRWSVA